MRRRDLINPSPLALASTIGHLALAQTPTAGTGSDSMGPFNVRSDGATGDAKSVDTAAINKAIEAAAGDGTLLFPAGIHLCFTIRLRSHVDLYLSRGCTILAANSPEAGEATGYNSGVYDPAGPPQAWKQYQDYGHNHWANSLFYGESICDCSVLGPDLIHGQALSHGFGGKRGDFPSHSVPRDEPGGRVRQELLGSLVLRHGEAMAAIRLKNGNMLITDEQNVISREVNPKRERRCGRCRRLITPTDTGMATPNLSRVWRTVIPSSAHGAEGIRGRNWWKSLGTRRLSGSLKIGSTSVLQQQSRCWMNPAFLSARVLPALMPLV